jgi:alpha-aminoadipate carrier protein LysW
MIECPECGADIDVEEDELDEGESILCEECGRNFVVSSVDPIELELEDDDLDEDEEFDEEFDEDEDEEEEEDEEEDEDDDWR